MQNRVSSGILRRCCVGVLSLCFGCASLAASQTESAATRPEVDPNGTVHLPAQAVPDTAWMSKEGNDSRTYYINMIGKPPSHQLEPGRFEIFEPFIAKARTMFPLDQQDTSIGGVHVIVYTPKDGIPVKNKARVLIHLHGGGFRGCWLDCGQLEAMPVAFNSKIKVVSVDYREGADNPFPAASEDVAKVYRELLKTYKPANIGMYGCSAGGALTAQALAWFQKERLPTPAAAGIFCAGGGGATGGDAQYTAQPLGELRMAPITGNPPENVSGYYKGQNMRNPLITPMYYSEILAKYPPTLFITGTRAMDLSMAAYTEAQLRKVNVAAELYVVEGGRHGFWYDPDLPESKEVIVEIVKFFNAHLGTAQ